MKQNENNKLQFYLIQTSINYNLIKRFNLCISTFMFVLSLFGFYKKVRQRYIYIP